MEALKFTDYQFKIMSYGRNVTISYKAKTDDEARLVLNSLRVQLGELILNPKTQRHGTLVPHYTFTKIVMRPESKELKLESDA